MNSNETSQRHTPHTKQNNKNPTVEEVEDKEVERERQWKEKLNSLNIPWIEEEDKGEFNEEGQQKLLEELLESSLKH